MPRSKATSVADYLEGIPADRRQEIERVRAVILRNLPKGYEETINWGMISYEIPLSTYSTTYNKQPLSYLGLAAQKNFNTLYMMTAAAGGPVERKLRDGFKKSGKKLDMGKSCIHFRSADDLALDTIAELIASTPPREWIAIFEKSRRK